MLAASGSALVDAVVFHGSGTAGAASLGRTTPGGETRLQWVQAFSYGWAPRAARPQVQQALIRSDAPFFSWLRSIAPRGLCILQARHDLCANPKGTRYMVDHLAPRWREFPERLQFRPRTGGHVMTLADGFRAAAFVRQLADADRR